MATMMAADDNKNNNLDGDGTTSNEVNNDGNYILLCSAKIFFLLSFLWIKGGANFKPTTSLH